MIKKIRVKITRDYILKIATTLSILIFSLLLFKGVYTKKLFSIFKGVSGKQVNEIFY